MCCNYLVCVQFSFNPNCKPFRSFYAPSQSFIHPLSTKESQQLSHHAALHHARSSASVSLHQYKVIVSADRIVFTFTTLFPFSIGICSVCYIHTAKTSPLTCTYGPDAHLLCVRLRRRNSCSNQNPRPQGARLSYIFVYVHSCVCFCALDARDLISCLSND